MSYPYSDEDSADSDNGIRFKTTNTRNHVNTSSYRPRHEERSDYHRRKRSRSRERSNRRSKHRSRTPDKHRRHTSKTSTEKSNNKSQQKKDTYLDKYGPQLPPKKETPSTSSHEESFIGPALPPSMKKTVTSNQQITEKQITNDDMYGPTLPPQVNNKIMLGPSIPSHLRSTLPVTNTPDDKSDSDDDIVGPLPAGVTTNNPCFMKLEERALEMKLNSLNKVENDNKVREEWMLELPQVHTANLGLGPRQFRAKGVPDMSDRSSWTDTPQDKQNKNKISKSDIKKEAEIEHLKKRDLEQEKIVEKHKKKKKRDKSLLDIHQEKLNKKKKEESSEKQIRRPFSRDIDLKANRFDEAQKKSILKKAQLLDNRFSSGESKFL